MKGLGAVGGWGHLGQFRVGRQLIDVDHALGRHYYDLQHWLVAVHHTADGGFGVEIPRGDLLVQQIDDYRKRPPSNRHRPEHLQHYPD